jgi:PAS domain S-box-containing protein
VSGHIWKMVMDGNSFLETNSKLLASLVNHVYDACLVYRFADGKPGVIYASDPFYNLTNFKPEEVIGKDPILYSLKNKQKNYYDEIIQAVLNGSIFEHELLCLAGHGVPFWVKLKAAPLKTEDDRHQNDCFLVVLQDITEKKRKETELKDALASVESSNKMKERFLANMSHEMRTPMNAIMGMAQLLEETDLSDEQKEYIEDIILSSDNLLAIINDILEFNFIESGALKLEFRKFKIRKQISQLMGTLRDRAEAKNLEFKHIVSDKVPEELVGDVVRFSQILIHLISNAIKFTKDGSVTVLVRTLEFRDGRIPVEVKVKDTGIGIPDDLLYDIFDSFNQASKSTTYKYGGTGLGLSIVNQLTGRMDGKLAVEKNDKKGTIFTITIPFELPEKSQVEKPSGDEKLPDNEETAVFKGNSVLVVDDYTINRKIVNGMLSKLGCSVDEAETGERALEMLEQKNYSIVLMDVHMPGIGGLEATKKIRSLKDKQKSRIPVIAITASVLERDISLCKDAGMDDFIAKPFTRRELSSIVKLHLGSKKNHSSVFTSLDKTDKNGLVDLKNLREMSGDDSEMLIEMIDIYISQTSLMMDELEQHFKNQDFKQMSMSAHTLKPTYNYVGVQEAFDLADSIEQEGKLDSPDNAKIKKMIDDLWQLSLKSTKELEKIRKSGV